MVLPRAGEYLLTRQMTAGRLEGGGEIMERGNSASHAETKCSGGEKQGRRGRGARRRRFEEAGEDEGGGVGESSRADLLEFWEEGEDKLAGVIRRGEGRGGGLNGEALAELPGHGDGLAQKREQPAAACQK
ncbi:hypothetical protein GOP47_0029011 [Adiantum capillus-veneris]|nr:hypothetical protein GOP47_0029011 [Adiantum capillus-veneris]